jgi:hypothetical protein
MSDQSIRLQLSLSRYSFVDEVSMNYFNGDDDDDDDDDDNDDEHLFVIS